MPFGTEEPNPGVGLALSGGGFRATLFHCGALWRLAELGYLGRLSRISSVSGGSITAGELAVKWATLEKAKFSVDEAPRLPVEQHASRRRGPDPGGEGVEEGDAARTAGG